MVLQALEGLSDRDAVRQLATNIAWKAAAGLALPDEAFHPADAVAQQAARLGRSGADLQRGPGRDHRDSSSPFPPPLHQLPGPAPLHYRD
jgi:hypothetical protein